MSEKHTPTPWYICGGNNVPLYINSADGNGVAMMDGILEYRADNAATILRAVNSFDPLVEALRRAHTYFMQDNHLTADDREMLDEMWAALKLAKEGLSK